MKCPICKEEMTEVNKSEIIWNNMSMEEYAGDLIIENVVESWWECIECEIRKEIS